MADSEKKTAPNKGPLRTHGQATLALSEEDKAELLGLQDELGLPTGTRPTDDAEYRRVTAHHEAGHVVAGHLLGRSLTRASVQDHCDFEPLPRTWNDDDLQNSIVIALAGPHAEVRASREDVAVGAGSDLTRAKGWARELAGDAWKERLEVLSVSAQKLVMDNWDVIEQVAARLVHPAEVLTTKDLPEFFSQT